MNEDQIRFYQGLAKVLTDLDRCPHGRHEGDDCAGWRGPDDYDGGCRGGRSLGNPHIRPGQVIGYGLYADLIVVPDRSGKNDPAGWRAPRPGGAV
jgi:hypothetical protein